MHDGPGQHAGSECVIVHAMVTPAQGGCAVLPLDLPALLRSASQLWSSDIDV